MRKKKGPGAGKGQRSTEAAEKGIREFDDFLEKPRAIGGRQTDGQKYNGNQFLGGGGGRSKDGVI